MDDLFSREQQILDNAVKQLNEIRGGLQFNIEDFETLTKEYGRLLRQLRRVTKISDRTTVDLNTSKLDLLEKVHYDSLTGLYNRRFMEDSLKRIIRTLSRSGGMLGVMMADIDFFKKYNDTYGHMIGDGCLKTVAKALKDSITREGDFIARYGGEEFIIVLPDTNEAGLNKIANRILEKVKACKIPHEKNEADSCVTISIGGTTCQASHTQSVADYIKRADEALYKSKENGRNRYTFKNFYGGLNYDS